ncbi:MAG: hydrogenase expression/formation protein [Proteobacteria bacterium]|nr:hydrogenase expression/formation protein [Pseudomonadota bacterium]
MKPFPLPVVTLGPGSQPVDEAADFVRLPDMMSVFQMPPHPLDASAAALAEARAFLTDLHAAAAAHEFGGRALLARDVTTLSAEALALVNEAFGEGEVAAIVEEPAMRLQETGFPGFWRVRGFDAAGALASDVVEVGPVPSVVREAALLGSRCRLAKKLAGAGVTNGPSLLTELVAASARGDDAPAHVINLTLLPVTPDDVNWLVAALEIGPVTLLSRGYGNCRITSTRLRNTWWVQYFNSMNTLILNTIEVAPVPEVALAAPDDFGDSLARLGEWLQTLE